MHRPTTVIAAQALCGEVAATLLRALLRRFWAESENPPLQRDRHAKIKPQERLIFDMPTQAADSCYPSFASRTFASQGFAEGFQIVLLCQLRQVCCAHLVAPCFRCCFVAGKANAAEKTSASHCIARHVPGSLARTTSCWKGLGQSQRFQK